MANRLTMKFLLARLHTVGQASNGRRRLSSSVTLPAGGRRAARRVGCRPPRAGRVESRAADTERRGPVRLRSVRATPCLMKLSHWPSFLG